MTALEYMEKQARDHRLNYDRESESGVPEEHLNNIKARISYYEQAIEALRMENILLNESDEIDFDYGAEDNNG